LLYGLLEGVSLQQLDGSFTEIFYQLKRQQQQRHATTKHKFLQWICLVTPTVLKTHRKSLSSLVQQMIAGLDAVSLGYKFLYLMDKSDYFSPLHHLLSIKFGRLSSSGTKYSLWDVIMWAIPLGLFLRRLTLWWRSVGTKKLQIQKTTNDTPLPTPPIFLIQNTDLKVTPGHCPLCEQVWKDPIVTKTGFIFCKNCILSALEKLPRCPLTAIPLKDSDLRPIYV